MFGHFSYYFDCLKYFNTDFSCILIILFRLQKHGCVAISNYYLRTKHSLQCNFCETSTCRTRSYAWSTLMTQISSTIISYMGWYIMHTNSPAHCQYAGQIYLTCTMPERTLSIVKISSSIGYHIQKVVDERSIL